MNINEISTSYILDLILEDLNGYIEFGSRKYIFKDENAMDILLGNWLTLFEDYPKEFTKEDKQFLHQEIGEYMGGTMHIWTNDADERLDIINLIKRYFGENKGFCKLILDEYKMLLKEDWVY